MNPCHGATRTRLRCRTSGRRWRWRAFIVLLLHSCASAHLHAEETTVSFGRFGEFTVYQIRPQPREVVLFVSGDGGWNEGVVDMARSLANLDALVAGIDITRYLRALGKSTGPCTRPAEDFEALSQFLQKRYGFTDYRRPVLVGYSSGATLVYATLAQAPAGTFAGAISLGFCPDLSVAKPFCRGRGLDSRPGRKALQSILLPAENLDTPWAVLQGSQDQVCDPAATANFVRQVPGGRLFALDKVGHGFSVQRNWLHQFESSFQWMTSDSAIPAGERQAAAMPVEIADLPVALVPAKSATGDVSDTLVFVMSGDGGWAGLDRDLATELAAAGAGVVGLDSLRYFWTKRTPDGTARDVAALIEHYLKEWQRRRIVLVGYSFGADLVPFVANRLPQSQRASLAGVVLLGPDESASFEFHVTSWAGVASGSDVEKVLPEIERMKGMRVLCIYGDQETDSLCTQLDGRLAKTLAIKGGHHFGGDYRAIAKAILESLR